MKGFLDRYQWLDKVSTAINGLGWDLYSLDHEDANSQFEFDFKYADALTMCDRYIFFRSMAKHYAAEEGLLATFMPKPFANRTGSGAHFNMSFYDLETGENLLTATTPTTRAASASASSAISSSPACSSTAPRSAPHSRPPSTATSDLSAAA